MFPDSNTPISRRSALQVMAAPAIARSRRRPGDKPNLLFLWTDQQKAATMPAYGNEGFRVPVMNRLAGESVVFERAYPTQPVCTPSRSSVMTGLWPHTTGCIHNNVPLPREIRTVPELLADPAYRTGYFGKWHLGDEVYAQHGFEEWASIEDHYRKYYSASRLAAPVLCDYARFLLRLGYKPDAGDSFSREFATTVPVEHSKPSFLAQRACRFIVDHRNEPWMAYVNFLEPHTPFSSALNDLHSNEEAPVPSNWPGIAAGEPRWYQRHRENQLRDKEFSQFNLGSRSKVQRANRNYAGLCALVDQALGRILWSLEASGQAENTAVIFTSDHGEMMGAHSMYAKQVMYEESIHVPLLLRAPYLGQKHMRYAAPASHIDLAPTVLDLLGSKAAKELSGQSHLAMLRESGQTALPVFLEWNVDPSGKDGQVCARAAVTPDGWKLVLHEGDRSMLFHRPSDPAEMHNLIDRAEHRSIRQRLTQQIRAWQKAVHDTAPPV